MELHLKDKVILITGGAKGIGAAIARTCSEEGAVPVIVDRDDESGRRLQTELRPSGPCGLVAVDLSTPESCSQAIAQTLHEFGRLDALVNNAAVNDKRDWERGTPEGYVAA